MACKIEYSWAFYEDVEGIFQYISKTLKNKEAAKNFVYKYQKVVETIKIFPRSGAVLERLNPFEMKYRFVPIGNYLLFYHILEERQIIHIDRVIYAHSDYEHLLKADEA